MVPSLMKNPDSTRTRILHYLMQNQSEINRGCTVYDIASALDLTPNAIRQHLKNLEKEKVIVQTKKKSSSGRPAQLYYIHDNAYDFFPKKYPDFSLKLINELKKKLGNEEVKHLMIKVGESIAEDMIKQLDKDLVKENSENNLIKKLERLTDYYKEYGKFPELIEEKDSFTLKNFNCLIYKVAKAEPIVCNVDATIFSKFIDQKVVKEMCIRDGDPYCLYRIKKKK